MKVLSVAAASLALASAISVPRKVSYDGFKVYRLGVGEDDSEIRSLVDSLQLNTWNGGVGTNRAVDIVVPPNHVNEFESKTQNYMRDVMHKDLGASIKEESNYRVYKAGTAANDTAWFTSYHSIDDHYQWLKDLAAAHSGNAEIYTVGKSGNGVDIQGIHIYGSGPGGKNPAIYFHGNVHAREWITSMTVEYTAYALLTSTDAAVKDALSKYDFYIIPIVNPDGFKYSQTNDRMWRKNRNANKGASCGGVDINRNWPYVWEQKQGASTSPCAQDYKGTASGSEVETQALRGHLDAVGKAQKLKMYIDFHSYSQLFMTPYGYTCDKLIANNDKYQELAKGTVAAIKSVNGLKFDSGPICSTIYQVSGDSVDYATDVAKAEWSFTVELRDTGRNGFVLPANQITPSVLEMFAGLQYLFKSI